VKETFSDVRLVGTPPQSSGKFGGDTDNWMWPRHTADFSMFRIYAGTDNKPAAFNAQNQPFAPRHSLPISLDGVRKDDYAMVLGFPGRTNRFLTSYGVEQAIKLEQPKIVSIREKKLQIMKKYMDQNTAIRLKYSSKYAQVANYWKYFIGQTEQLKNNKVTDIVEKQKISDYACSGAYGFESYKLLLQYSTIIVENNIKQNGEYYTSTVIKEMLHNNIIFYNELIDVNNWTCLGTPIQIKQFCNNFPKHSCINNDNKIKKMRICFDLDNTLLTYPEIKNDYTSVKPIQKNIDFLHYLKSFGHIIIIYTARRMKTHSGNIGKIL
jgi:hypothetical protein